MNPECRLVLILAAPPIRRVAVALAMVAQRAQHLKVVEIERELRVEFARLHMVDVEQHALPSPAARQASAAEM